MLTNTCSMYRARLPRRAEPNKERTDGSDQAPAGDIRLHQTLLSEVRVSADRARYRQGGRARVVLDGPRAPREPRTDRAAEARSDQAARDRAARPGLNRRAQLCAPGLTTRQ